MATLSELIAGFNLIYTCEYIGHTTDDYGNDKNLFMVTITTDGANSRTYTGPFLTEITNVIMPLDLKYHPRYEPSLTDGTPEAGKLMALEWWYIHGKPRKPSLNEVVASVASFAFFMKDVNDFTEYALYRKLNPDSIKDLRKYERDVVVFNQIKDFLGEYYDAFINATVDI